MGLMKNTGKYRIVDEMGKFYPQAERTGYLGMRVWRYFLVEVTGSFERFQKTAYFDTKREAEKWLEDTLSERKRLRALKNRGRVVVSEIDG